MEDACRSSKGCQSRRLRGLRPYVSCQPAAEACCFADWLLRRLRPQAFKFGRALIHGQPASVVGRVAMNMTMVDVTDVGADLDDEVVLIGRQGEAEIRVEDLADKIGTISYEVVA